MLLKLLKRGLIGVRIIIVNRRTMVFNLRRIIVNLVNNRNNQWHIGLDIEYKNVRSKYCIWVGLFKLTSIMVIMAIIIIITII